MIASIGIFIFWAWLLGAIIAATAMTVITVMEDPQDLKDKEYLFGIVIGSLGSWSTIFLMWIGYMFS